MANTNKGKKIKKWSANDEDRLIYNVKRHVLCLKRAFEATSKEIQRSPKAVAAHWYTQTSRNCGLALFVTMSGRHYAVNRKNSNGQPLKLPLYKKVLAFLGLTC